MKYFLPILALGISCSIYPMKRETPENGKEEHDHAKKVAKTSQLSPLRQAIVNKNKEKIHELGVSADEINKVDEDGYTPFIGALSFEDKDTIEFLLAHGARASSEDASNDFLLAVIRGDLSRVSELIKGGIDVNVLGYAGYTALMCASTVEIAELLIAAGCNIHARNVRGRQALHLASLRGHVELSQLLISSGADINNHPDDKGLAPLVLAAQKGFIEIADMLLKAGALLQYSSNTMLTPLMSAISNNQEKMVKFLLDRGANVNQIWDCATRKGITPLSYAVEKGLKEVVKILLDARAYINTKDNNGFSPLIIAVRSQSQNKDIAELLLKAKADVNQEDNKRCTPLIHAAHLGYIDIAEMLLKEGADVNYVATSKLTALTIALMNKQEEMVKFLLKAGANVNQPFTSQTKDGVRAATPLIYALELGLTGIVKALLDANANVNQPENNRCIPLSVAIQRRDKEMVNLLIQAGADVNLQDSKGWTPLMFASQFGLIEIVRMLLDKGADVNSASNIGSTALSIAINNKHDEVAKELASREARVNPSQNGLMRAVMAKDEEAVKRWLAVGVNVNQQDTQGLPPLLAAISMGATGIVKLLLEAGADVNVASDAVMQRDEETAQRWLGLGVNIHQQNPRGSTPLLIAIRMDAIAIIKILLDAGADVNLANNAGTAPLTIALLHNKEELVAELLKRGANVNMQDAQGQTPFIEAVVYGNISIIKMLLNAGGDVSIANNSGTAALTRAFGSDKILKEFCKAGVNFSIRFSDGSTALIWAVKKGDIAMIAKLLKVGADVQQPDDKGVTPLMHAAKASRKDIVEVLLEAGADPKGGDTSLSIAVFDNQKELVKELIQQGADVNVKYVNGKTLLSQAIAHKDIEMIELLLEAKADINQQDSKGRTPLMYAAQRGYEAIVDLLLKYEADISIRDYGAVSAAASKGHMALVSKLLALVPKKNNRKVLAHIFDKALRNGSLELVNRTLAVKPNLAEQFLPGSANVSPIMFLAQQEVCLKMARLLKEDDETIAELKAKSKRATELQLLITLCKTGEVQDYLGKKPGALAIVQRHLESDKYIRNQYKQTVLMWAAMFGHNNAVKKILSTLIPVKKKKKLPDLTDKEVRANNTSLDRAVRFINAQDVRGRTALMYAILYGYNDIAQTLIPYCGSSINLKDEDGYTALAYAARRGSIELIKILREKGARITTPAIKEAAEENHDRLAVSFLGEKMGSTMLAFGTLT